MKILIVYDSFFGNTEQIALAIGKGFEGMGEVQVKRPGNVEEKDYKGIDFLFVGSPTRKFTATKAIKMFIKNIPSKSLQGVKTAAFDTRIDVKKINNRLLNTFVSFFGYAAEPLSERLKKKGGKIVLPPEGFYVLDSEGPLQEGEYERAIEWAKGAFQES
ncbi:flavodoxin family protein [Fidelibacter multiformis]|uniref:flavodoxin family protein n=1 Tax=Fidelibacter multiformis TaxID=3377529 RepID=UPI0037DDA33B